MAVDSKKIFSFDSSDQFQQEAASQITRCALESVKARGRFSIALSGGNTPKGVYQTLAQSFKKEFPWQKSFFFFGDERMVPSGHADSNYNIAYDYLFSLAKVDENHIYRIKTEKNEPNQVALDYEKIIQNFFALSENQFPSFDLILLGLGTDGHAASLFPNTQALSEKKRLVVANYVEKLKAYRITMTIPVFNQAQNVFFLVSAKDKRKVIQKVIHEPAKNSELPATFIQSKQTNPVWFINES